MTFTYRRRPTYAEVDQQGVVFHGHWLAYFDDAMTRFCDHLGFPPKEVFFSTFDVMVVKAELDWQGPAGFDDEIEIAVTPVRLGTKAFDLEYRATVEGRPVCTGVVTYVSVKPVSGGSVPIPDDVRAALADQTVSTGTDSRNRP